MTRRAQLVAAVGQSDFRTERAATAIIKHSAMSYAFYRGIDVVDPSTGYIDSTTTNGNTDFGLGVYGTTYSYGNNNFPDGVRAQGMFTTIAGD